MEHQDALTLINRIKNIEERFDRLDRLDRFQCVAKYGQTTAQTYNNSTLTRINYNYKIYDPMSLVATGASWAFTAPVSGYYLVNAHLMFEGYGSWSLVTDYAHLSVVVNGSTLSYLDYRNNFDSSAAHDLINAYIAGTTIVYIARTQTVYFNAFQQSGANLAVNLPTDAYKYNYCSIHYTGL